MFRFEIGDEVTHVMSPYSIGVIVEIDEDIGHRYPYKVKFSSRNEGEWHMEKNLRLVPKPPLEVEPSWDE